MCANHARDEVIRAEMIRLDPSTSAGWISAREDGSDQSPFRGGRQYAKNGW